jgi:protein-disulfide isomerase
MSKHKTKKTVQSNKSSEDEKKQTNTSDKDTTNVEVKENDLKESMETSKDQGSDFKKDKNGFTFSKKDVKVFGIFTLSALVSFLVLINGFSLFMVYGLNQKVTELENNNKQMYELANEATGAKEDIDSIYAAFDKFSPEYRPERKGVNTNLEVDKPSPEQAWLGDENAKYALIVYTDLNCPYCGRIHDTLIQLEEEYKGELAIVYRNLPIISPAKSEGLAQSMECAQEQGGGEKFWDMADYILDNNISEAESLKDRVDDIDLDKEQFNECLDSGKYKQKVDDSVAKAKELGVQTTPTSILYNLDTGDNETISGALPFEDFQEKIEEFKNN